MNRLTPLLACLGAAMLVGCGARDGDSTGADDDGNASAVIATGDLDAIRARGELRIIVGRERESYLPRHGPGLYEERELARQFAADQGLEARLVYVDRFEERLPALLEGRGDIVAANLTVTDEREAVVEFTEPLEYSRETLAVARSHEVPAADDPLVGTLGARIGTTLLATARALAAENPDLAVVEVDGAVTNEDLLDRLVAGEFDFVVQDGNVLEHVLDYRDDIAAGPVVTEPRPLAWAVRPDNPALLRSLNAFLAEYRLLGRAEPRYVADLPELRDRRRLRMITTNNAATYFLWRGELLGFEYELARRFAEKEELRLEVVVARDHDEMLPLLLAGEGDFVAAFLVPTEARREMGVAFTRPYHYASEVIVGRSSEERIESLGALAGRKIAVRRSSAYWTHVEALVDSGELDVELVAAPADMETQEIIDRVARGEFDLTVADSHILDIELTWRDDIEGMISLGEERPHSWAVHPANEALLAAMNAYLAASYRGLYYNISYEKYFRNSRYVQEDPAALVEPGRLSPYDAYARQYGTQYGFDWRLLVAQMYQESRFDPDARSWMGAVGLMQVLPRTGREFGFEDLRDPETGIHAGVRYLDWVRERFPRRLQPAERTWFALAGYNAGQGHVHDARRLARQLGYDPNRWFENVEYAMLKLSDPEYASKARHGYVRGSEPVKYVRSIRDRFQAYAQLLE